MAAAAAEEGISREVAPESIVAPGSAGARMVAALAAAEDAQAAQAAKVAAAATASPGVTAAAAAGATRLFVRSLSWLEDLARPACTRAQRTPVSPRRPR